MKKILSILLAMIMMLALSTSVLADGVNIGQVIGDKTYEDVVYDAPNASAYQMIYTVADPATTKVGEKIIRTRYEVAGIRIECYGTSGTHDIQIEVVSLTNGNAIISNTYTASNTELKSYYIPFSTTVDDIYRASVTHPEGTEGWVRIYFEAPPSINSVEDVTE